MVTAVRVTRGLTLGTTGGLAAQINKQIEVEARKVGVAAVNRVNQIVEREFHAARTTTSRRPGRHLLGSFTADVKLTSGPYPVVITLRSTAPAVKVNVLNNGSAPHEIGADGRRIAFPSAAGTTSPRTGDKRLVRRGPIQHPGTQAHWFMQRALEQAVAEVYRKTVRIPRRKG